MEKLYIDESGSMTVHYCNIHPYFVIAIIRVKDSQKLKRVYKRFVQKHHSDLMAADKNNAMFNNGKFKELKGNAFTPALKRSFVNFFCKNEYFEIYYIVADNRKVAQEKNGKLYDNTARSFNFLLRIALEYYINHHFLDNTGLNISLDERNERSDSKHFLQQYLNTEFIMRDVLTEKCTVSYFDSANNTLIQIADVFANLMYSELKTGAYKKEFDFMRESGYLKHTFHFPLNK